MADSDLQPGQEPGENRPLEGEETPAPQGQDEPVDEGVKAPEDKAE